MGNRIDPKLQAWIEARKRHRLSHAQVQMARELGLNPKKLGGIDNHKAEPWKLPLPEFIESLYLKRFGRFSAPPVRSIEELAAAKQGKKKVQASPPANPRFPDRKISETILDFGAPLLGELPPEPPIEVFRNVMTVIIMVWNAGAMAFPIWRKQASTDIQGQWETLLRTAPEESRAVFEELAKRRASEPFRTDQRGVGEWSVMPNGKGSFNFRCDARLPDDPDKPSASRAVEPTPAG